jgi:site-specific recombinase XerD
MSRRRVELPPFAVTYLSTVQRQHAHKVVALFHGWLERARKELTEITGADIEAFVAAPCGTQVRQLTRNNYRYDVRLYLRWLEERGLAGPFDAEELDGYHRRPLPDDVRRFLQFLAPTRRLATVRSYRGVLRRFREWAAKQNIPIEKVDRSACLAWAQQLHEDGMHPSTRVGMLVCVRKYLDWLWEQGVIPLPGRELLLGSDLPKKPEYLPRPLPPKADEELQSRLKGADSQVARGLYVMRRTGLRIGELRRLERDCVREDHAGGHFLKVPLGKMNNERLVPLDPETLRAISDLQSEAREGSRWLIEGARARPVSPTTYQSMLAKVGGNLPLPEPLTTHRLRHTYATSLMNGGMSLLGIMKLLGHRDQRMTLRYTKIADETVGREYFEALTRISERYELFRPSAEMPLEIDPLAQLQDVIRWVTKNLCVGDLVRRARILIRRLEAVRDELQVLRELTEA